MAGSKTVEKPSKKAVEVAEGDERESTQEEESVENQDVEVLQSLGINSVDIKKLKATGISTLLGIQQMTKKRLAEIKGLSEAKVDKIKEAVEKICGKSLLQTGYECMLRRKKVFKISTGSKALDSILGGGVESQSLTEVFGEFRAGKTQLSHTLCVSCQVPSGNFSGGKAIFMDTENTFRPDRLAQIASRFGLNPDKVLKNVIVTRCFTTDMMMEALDLVAGLLHQERPLFKLLIVDSVMALFRVDYSGRGELSERQQKLAQFLAKLQKLAEEYNVSVFMTNQMSANPAASVPGAPTMIPVGGHILAHASQTRIFLRKGSGVNRSAKIWDSPEMPEAECKYSITTGGVDDTADAD